MLLRGDTDRRDRVHPLDRADSRLAWVEEGIPIVDRCLDRLHYPRLARAFGREFLHAEAVLDRDAVGIEIVEEHAARRRMAAWAVDDRHLRLVEARDSATDVVDLGHHEVDVVQHRFAGATQTDAMMIAIWVTAHKADRAVDHVGNAKA